MSSRRPLTLAARRRTSSTPEIEALDTIDLWLERHRNSHRLVPDGDHHTHLYRRTVHDPWAEVGTYPDAIDFALAQAIIPRRPA